MTDTQRKSCETLAAEICLASRDRLHWTPPGQTNDMYTVITDAATGVKIGMSYNNRFTHEARPEFSLHHVEYKDTEGRTQRLHAHQTMRHGENAPRCTSSATKAPDRIAGQLVRFAAKAAPVWDTMTARAESYGEDAIRRVAEAKIIAARLGVEYRTTPDGGHDFGRYGRQFKQQASGWRVTLDLDTDQAARLADWIEAEGLNNE